MKDENTTKISQFTRRFFMKTLAGVTGSLLVPPMFGSGVFASPATNTTSRISDGVLRIGVLDDMNGVYSDVTGQGTVVGVKLAVADAGGKVLKKPIDVISANGQNDAGVSSLIARKWIDEDKVDVILAGGGSAPTSAILDVTKNKNKTLLISGAGSTQFTGKECALTSTHWAYDTYSLAASVAKAIVNEGGKTWFFITADYSFGHNLEQNATHFIEGGGGKVVGTARHPVGASDFSSYLLSAKNSGASVIGLANAGGDLVNTIKQAYEFGIPQGGQRLAALLIYINDVQALGSSTAEGLMGATSFYHDQSAETQAWTKRYMARFPGHIPNMLHAGAYAAVNHYLKAVEATGTDDATTVGKKMRELPVNDFYNNNVRIREDGRVLQDMMLWQAKAPNKMADANDLLAIRQTLPGAKVYRPESEGGCPLVT